MNFRSASICLNQKNGNIKGVTSNTKTNTDKFACCFTYSDVLLVWRGLKRATSGLMLTPQATRNAKARGRFHNADYILVFMSLSPHDVQLIRFWRVQHEANRKWCVNHCHLSTAYSPDSSSLTKFHRYIWMSGAGNIFHSDVSTST